MDRATSSNLINKISISPGIKKMSVSELKDLSDKIQIVLNSLNTKTIKTSELGNNSIRLQAILNACEIKNMSSRELENLESRIKKILIAHDKKIIKYCGVTKASKKGQVIFNSPSLKMIPDLGIYKLKKEIFV
jgi:hypothetical protein